MDEGLSPNPYESGELGENTTTIIARQLGKTVDVANYSEYRRIGQDLAIEEPEGDRVSQGIIFVNQHLEELTINYPGLLTKEHDRIRSLADREDKGGLELYLLRQTPLKRIFLVENWGLLSFNTLQSEKRLFGVPVSADDWQQSLVIAKSFPKELNSTVPVGVKEAVDASQLISEISTKYKNGEKPTVRECVQGRSISEPKLQWFIGGTPVEGLSSAAYRLGDPLQLRIGKQKFTNRQGSTVDAESLVNFGDFGLMREASQATSMYLRFISKILEEHPDISQIMSEDEGEGFSRYLDLEWQRKDEALEVAANLQNVLQKKIEFLRTLTS